MGEKKIHEDQKYITGLQKNNAFIIQTIYDKFVPKVVNYIKQNSGSAEEAQDVIQETLITIYKQANQKNLELTCPFDAYFFFRLTLGKAATLVCGKKSADVYSSMNWLLLEKSMYVMLFEMVRASFLYSSPSKAM